MPENFPFHEQMHIFRVGMRTPSQYLITQVVLRQANILYHMLYIFFTLSLLLPLAEWCNPMYKCASRDFRSSSVILNLSFPFPQVRKALSAGRMQGKEKDQDTKKKELSPALCNLASDIPELVATTLSHSVAPPALLRGFIETRVGLIQSVEAVMLLDEHGSDCIEE